MPSRTPVCPIRSRRCSWIHLNYTITCRSRQSCQLPLCDDKSRRSTHPHPRRPLRMALRNIQTRLTCPRLPHLYWHSRSHSRKLLEFQLFHSRSHITISARAHQQVQAWATPSSLTSVPLMASFKSSVPSMTQRLSMLKAKLTLSVIWTSSRRSSGSRILIGLKRR